MNWLVVLLAMIGKLAITSSYGTIYIFSTEQFPTVIRNAGLGAGSMSARLGSVFAPLINETVRDAIIFTEHCNALIFLFRALYLNRSRLLYLVFLHLLADVCL